jgi:aspartyl-tRNA(Asn)/glutamyl-tRNA(Gln) amidotransferase subunit B
LPPLPAARRASLAKLTGADVEGEAISVVVERGQDDYVAEVAAAGGDAARALVWVQQAFAEEGESPKLPAADLAALTNMETGGKITATQAKVVLADMLAAGGGDPAAIAAAKGFEALDTSEIEGFVDQAIAAQPDAWAKYCAGEEKAAGALVGAIMKASKGKADGKIVTSLLQQRRGT